jgi:hypothetical protein
VLDSVVIDVVIALTLIFLVFSLVTSGVRELVARILETRAKELWRSLRGLLEDPISSDLRELHAFAGSQVPVTRDSLLAAISAAESRLRDAIAAGATSEQWRAAVDDALARVVDAAAAHGVDGEMAPLVTTATRRLWLEHRTGRRALFGLVRAGRRGGERPVVPELPTPAGVADLAAAVRRGTKTLTDAVNEHPLVRQVDTTWPGFHSRLREISSGDFSGALVDLLRAAGVEPAVKAGLVEVGRAINALPLDDDEKETVWAPIGEGFDQIEGLLIAGTATLADYEAIAARIDRSVLGDAAALRLAPADVAAVRDRVAEVRELVLRLQDDPLALVRIGAEALEDAAPVKPVLERLIAEARRTSGDAWASLAVLRDSVGGWYDSRMGALSAWYRKRSRFVAFGLGLLVVVAFNVDAIGVPQELWQNENVRNLVVAVADTSTVDLDACRDSPDRLSCVEGTIEELVDIGLPIGWDVGTECDGSCDGILETISYALGTEGGGVRGAVVKLLGWTLAAAALAMGSSFWYDVLTRASGFKKGAKGTDAG